jgi:hypothetical protein
MNKVIAMLVLFSLSSSAFAQVACRDAVEKLYKPNQVVTYELRFSVSGSYVSTGSHQALRRGHYGIPELRQIGDGYLIHPEINLVKPNILIKVTSAPANGGYERVILTGRLNDVIRQIMRLRSDEYDNNLGLQNATDLQRQYILKLASDIDGVMSQFPLERGTELDSDVKAGLAVLSSWFLPIPENYRPDSARPLKPWEFGWKFFKVNPENIGSPLVRPGPLKSKNPLEFGQAPTEH